MLTVSVLLRLLYVSDARPGLGDNDIATILDTARRHNEPLGITGALSARGDHFAQVLEGPELAVLQTYVRIAEDDRHSNPQLITISHATDRIYPDWFMGGVADDSNPLVRIDELRALRDHTVRRDQATLLMGRWLTLLQSQTKP